jgi:DNA-directed RNA polymerase specialized sigma24 family protein
VAANKIEESEVPSHPSDVSLDRIARLLGLLLIRGIPNQADQIIALSAGGFSAAEIATLLGTTRNTVSVRLSQQKSKIKKKQRKKKKKKKEE